MQVQLQHRIQGISPEPALCIPRTSACFKANPQITEFPTKAAPSGHVTCNLIAISDQYRVRRKQRKKPWDVFGKVLAVSVQCDEILGAVVGSIFETRTKCFAFSPVGRVPDHRHIQWLE